MISGLDVDKFDRGTTKSNKSYAFQSLSDSTASVVDRLDVAVNEQNKKNNKYEERMKHIAQIADNAKNSNTRTEKKLHRFNTQRIEDINRLRELSDKQNNHLQDQLKETDIKAYRLESKVRFMEDYMINYEAKQDKRNKIIVGFITGIILYMIIMTVLFFNAQSKLKVFSSPKSMDVIMYDRDNKKEIHYSAYVKIDTDKGTVELQETRKEDEIDISNKVE